MGRTGGIGRMGAAVAVAALICQVGCNRPASPPTSTMPAHQDFEKLTDDFTRSVLALSPVAATQAGYHEHNGMALDEALDDFSAAGIDAQRRFYQGIRSGWLRWTWPHSTRSSRPIWRSCETTSACALLELDTIQSYQHNPTVYVELAGNALYTPVRAELRAARRAASGTSSSASRRFPRCSSRPRRTSSMRRRSGTAWRARRTTATSS